MRFETARGLVSLLGLSPFNEGEFSVEVSDDRQDLSLITKIAALYQYHACVDLAIRVSEEASQQMQNGFLDPGVIWRLPEDQIKMIENAHHLCSDGIDGFWDKVLRGEQTIPHAVEHIIMAVCINIQNMIADNSGQDHVRCTFLLMPTDQGYRIYIAQERFLSYDFFSDIIQLAVKYADCVLAGRSMDISRIMGIKAASYNPEGSNPSIGRVARKPRGIAKRCIGCSAGADVV